MGRLSKEMQIVRSLSSKPSKIKTPPNELVLPNHSGINVHPELKNNYLKLDCSNDPLTEGLEIKESTADTQTQLTLRNDGANVNTGSSIDWLNTNVGATPMARIHSTVGAGFNDNKLFIDVAGSTAVTITDTQNVGIGTTSPLTQLELAGSGPSGIAFFDTVGTDSFNIRPSGDTLIFSIDVNHDGSQNINTMVFDDAGNVGIGTSAPAYSKCEVQDSATGNITPFTITNAHGAVGDEVSMAWSVSNSAPGFSFARIGVTRNAAADGDMRIYTGSAGAAPTEKMMILGGGNVGVGTSTPWGKLEVEQISHSTVGSNLNLFLSNPGAASDIAQIGFGYRSGTKPPVIIGHNSTDASGSTKGDFFIATRAGTTDIAPTKRVIVDSDGNLDTAKVRITPLGGIAVKLTNKTGSNSVAGQLVKADTATNDAVILTAAGDVECIGVFLDSGVADAAEAWVVISGIADVAHDDNVAAARGNWISTGVLAGYAATAASPAAAPTHFEEIGHCIETVAAGGAGTHILARCVLHFN